MKIFINRLLASFLSFCMIGLMPVQAQTSYDTPWQAQQGFAFQNDFSATGNMVEDPNADLLFQAQEIRKSLLAEENAPEAAMMDQKEFGQIYKQETSRAYQAAKQEARADSARLEQIEKEYVSMISDAEIKAKWNKGYGARFSTMPDSQDLSETEKQLRAFGKSVMDSYDQSKTQNLLEIIVNDFPLYASIGALDTDVQSRARAVLRDKIAAKTSACSAKNFSPAACNSATKMAASLAVLGDFKSNNWQDLKVMDNLLTAAYEGPMAYHAVFFISGALLSAGQTGAIKSLLVDIASAAKEKQEDLLGAPIFSVEAWTNAIQNEGGDVHYLIGYENTFYDINSLDEGSGNILTDLGEYFAQEAAKGDHQAKEILDAVARYTIHATPFRPRRLVEVQMTPFWAGAIGGGYIVQSMGYRGQSMDKNGKITQVDTTQYWNETEYKLRQQNTDLTGYIAYQLYVNPKSAVNAWTALYANNMLADIIQAHNPNQRVYRQTSPSSQQLSRAKTQKAFLQAAPWADLVVEIVAMDIILTQGVGLIRGAASVAKGVRQASRTLKVLKFRDLQLFMKAARAGLSTKLVKVAAQIKTPAAAKKIQRLRRAVLRKQRRMALRAEIYTAASAQLGLSSQLAAQGLKGTKAVVKGTQAASVGHSARQSGVVELSENSRVATQAGLQRVETPTALQTQARVQSPARNGGLATRTSAASETGNILPGADLPAAASPVADAVPTGAIEGSLSGPLDAKVAAASGKPAYQSPKLSHISMETADDLMMGPGAGAKAASQNSTLNAISSTQKTNVSGVYQLNGKDGKTLAYAKISEQGEITRTKQIGDIIDGKRGIRAKYPNVDIEYPQVLAEELSALPAPAQTPITKEIEILRKGKGKRSRLIQQGEDRFFVMSGVETEGITLTDIKFMKFDTDPVDITKQLSGYLQNKPITSSEWDSVQGIIHDMNRAGFEHGDLGTNLFIKRQPDTGRLKITLIDFESFDGPKDVDILRQLEMTLQQYGVLSL